MPQIITSPTTGQSFTITSEASNYLKNIALLVEDIETLEENFEKLQNKDPLVVCQYFADHPQAKTNLAAYENQKTSTQEQYPHELLIQEYNRIHTFDFDVFFGSLISCTLEHRDCAHAESLDLAEKHALVGELKKFLKSFNKQPKINI